MTNLIKILLKRYERYFKYIVNYFIYERPKGLDFSMRGKSKVSHESNNGYALTSREAILNILHDLPITSEDSFIDIGSGKGGVICFIFEQPFKKITGIECEKWLHDIAMENIKRLKLSNKVCSLQADARYFDNYHEYNYFFMFNPFSNEIYSEVVNKIVKSFEKNKINDKWLICYGSANIEAVQKTGYFELFRSETCPHRLNDINIFKSINHS